MAKGKEGRCFISIFVALTFNMNFHILYIVHAGHITLYVLYLYLVAFCINVKATHYGSNLFA